MALPAAEVKARSRGALNTNPTGRFTMDRAALAEFENNGLKKHFAEWITKMTHVPVSEKTFCEDLKDGTALCSIMARIEGSGIPKFHNVKQSPKHLREFQRRDNLVGFQDACRRLALPDTVTSSEIEEGNETKIISVLLHLQDLCEEEQVVFLPEDGVEEPLRKRVSSKRTSKKRTSAKRSKGGENDLMAQLKSIFEQIKALCGCKDKTVVE